MVNATEWLEQNFPNSERPSINKLDVSNKNLEGDLEIGAEFSNLKMLNASFNDLSIINWAPKSLAIVDFSHNRINRLDIYHTVNLKVLNGSHNNMNQLFFRDAPNLEHLDVSNNVFAELDLRQTSRNLLYLNCSNNPKLGELGNDLLSLPEEFEPISFDCRGTMLGKVKSVFSIHDCQRGASSKIDTTNFSSSTLPTSASLSSSSPTASTSNEVVGDGLSTSDKIALGTGIGIGVPGLLMAVLGVWFAYKQFKN